MDDAERILAMRPQDVLGLITAERLSRFAPACDAEALAPALEAAAERYAIDTLDRASQWLGQIHVESRGLTRLEEDLGYSARRLCEVWPSRFPSLAAASACAWNPQALAEAVYGGRLGNVKPGDGYRYRGRGLIQLTGRANYARFGQMLGLDLEGDPDLAAQAANAALIAGAFWNDRGLNALADRRDIRGITRAINGGVTGLADRAMQVTRAREALR